MYNKQIPMLLCISSVIDHRRCRNVERTSVTHPAITSCATLFGSYHILTSFVINYETDTWQHGIYLLNKTTWVMGEEEQLIKAQKSQKMVRIKKEKQIDKFKQIEKQIECASQSRGKRVVMQIVETHLHGCSFLNSVYFIYLFPHLQYSTKNTVYLRPQTWGGVGGGGFARI